MKKIEFGYSNADEPTGAWEALTIKEGTYLYEAEYYGTVRFDDAYYMVSKVNEDKYNRYPNLVGKFIVREALMDVYPDASIVMFLDSNETSVSNQLETYLNMNGIRENISTYDDIFKYLNGVGKNIGFFSLLDLKDKVTATSIRHNVFESKKQVIQNCRDSFYGMQLRLNELENIKQR